MNLNNISSYEQQNNNVQLNPTGSAPVQISGAEKPQITIPVNIDAILKKYNLTFEQWQLLSFEKQQEYINNASNELSADFDYPKGCCVEKNSDNSVLEVQNVTNTEVEEQPTSTIKHVTVEDWKAMSAEERAKFCEDYLFEKYNLNEIPKDKRQEVLRELIDNKLKKENKRFDSFSECRKDKLRKEMISNFSIIIEEGFTLEEFESLSTVEKLQEKIDLNNKQLQQLEEEVAIGEITKEKAENIKQKVQKENSSLINKQNLSQIEELTEEEYANSAISRFTNENGSLTEENFDLYMKFIKSKYKNREQNEEFFKEQITDTIALIQYAQNTKNSRLEQKLLNQLDGMGFDAETIQKIREGNIDPQLLARLQKTNDYALRLAAKHENQTALGQTSEMQGVLVLQTGKTSEAFNETFKNNPKFQRHMMGSFLKTTGSMAVFNAANGLVPQASKENQNPLFDMQMGYTNTFTAPQDQIDAQKSLNDIIPLLYVDNQLGAYKTIQTSQYEEVQQYAASNIYKLDESIIDQIIEFTKSLGNENITKAIQSSPPIDTNNSRNASSVSGASNPNSMYTTGNIVTGNSVASVASVESTSNQISKIMVEDSDLNGNQSKNFIEEFARRTPQEQMAIIDSLPETYKKSAITMIGRFNKLLLGQYIAQGKGTDLLAMNLPVDVQNKIIDMMFAGNSKNREAAYQFIKSNKLEKLYHTYVATYERSMGIDN